MTDIARRLRQTRADMIGTDDESHYLDCHEAAAEIERLRLWGRLTDKEREAIEYFAGIHCRPGENVDSHCATLRALLERLP